MLLTVSRLTRRQFEVSLLRNIIVIGIILPLNSYDRHPILAQNISFGASLYTPQTSRGWGTDDVGRQSVGICPFLELT